MKLSSLSTSGPSNGPIPPPSPTACAGVGNQMALAQRKASLLGLGANHWKFQSPMLSPCNKTENNFYCPENRTVFCLLNPGSGQQVLILVWGLFQKAICCSFHLIGILLTWILSIGGKTIFQAHFPEKCLDQAHVSLSKLLIRLWEY